MVASGKSKQVNVTSVLVLPSAETTFGVGRKARLCVVRRCEEVNTPPAPNVRATRVRRPPPTFQASQVPGDKMQRTRKVFQEIQSRKQQYAKRRMLIITKKNSTAQINRRNQSQEIKKKKRKAEPVKPKCMPEPGHKDRVGQRQDAQSLK